MFHLSNHTKRINEIDTGTTEISLAGGTISFRGKIASRDIIHTYPMREHRKHQIPRGMILLLTLCFFFILDNNTKRSHCTQRCTYMIHMYLRFTIGQIDMYACACAVYVTQFREYDSV